MRYRAINLEGMHYIMLQEYFDSSHLQNLNILIFDKKDKEKLLRLLDVEQEKDLSKVMNLIFLNQADIDEWLFKFSSNTHYKEKKLYILLVDDLNRLLFYMDSRIELVHLSSVGNPFKLLYNAVCRNDKNIYLQKVDELLYTRS